MIKILFVLSVFFNIAALQAVSMGYQYTGQDIENILQSSFKKTPLVGEYKRFHLDENNDLVLIPDEDPDFYSIVTFSINNTKFITPSAEQSRGFHLLDYFREHVTRIIKSHSAPMEIIIPYNPGGHWVTLWIKIEEAKVDMTYIDSLRFGGNTAVFGSLMPVIHEFFPERPIEVKSLKARIQNDGSSCGILTTQNIMDMAREIELEDGKSMSFEDIRMIRTSHVSDLSAHEMCLDTKC